MVQRLFSPFTTDEDSSRLDVLADVCADGLAGFKLNVFFARIVLNMGFPTAVKTFETSLQPRNASLHETDAHIRALFEDTVKDNARERDHLAERVTKPVDRSVWSEIVHAQALVGAAMDPQAAPQSVSFSVNRPILFRAKMS